MTIKTVSHPIKLYGIDVWSELGISGYLKSKALRSGIQDLLCKGRAVITAGYDKRFDVLNLSYQGVWAFETVYLGRKAVHKKGIRHQLRKAYQGFNPYVIPDYE